MATRKTRTSASSASATRKLTKRLPSAKKNTSKNSAKKPAKKKSSQKSRKAAAGAKSSKSSSKKKDANSVDGILKKFVQERSSLDLHLGALDKKIADLEKKTKLYQEQLVSLGQDKEATLSSIAQIDTRRDLEVSQLLAKLGVKVTEVAPPASTTTVVFDVKPADDDGHHQGNGEASHSDEEAQRN